MNFWDNTHPLATDNLRLYQELVPSSGNCPTMQGECMRASGKIAYDWYNNGWGCNNWSGAVVFLRNHLEKLADHRTPAEFNAFNRALSRAHNFSHGERADISDELADETVTAIVAFVTQCVLDTPVPMANVLDMYNFSEPAARDEDDFEDSDY